MREFWRDLSFSCLKALGGFFVLSLAVFSLGAHSQSPSLWDRCRSVFTGSSKAALQGFSRADSYEKRQKVLKELDDPSLASLLRQAAFDSNLSADKKQQIIQSAGKRFSENNRAVLGPLLSILENRFENISVREASIEALEALLKQAPQSAGLNRPPIATQAQGETGSNPAPTANESASPNPHFSPEAQAEIGPNRSPAEIKAIRRMAKFLAQPDQNIYFLKERIAQTLKKIGPEDPKALYFLSQALWANLGSKNPGEERRIESMRRAIYDMLEGPLLARQTSSALAEGQNLAEGRELSEGTSRPAFRLTGRLRKKILHNLAQTLRVGSFQTEEKIKVLDLLEKANPRDILTVQWMADGLRDRERQVVIQTAKALGVILKTKLLADRMMIVVARGFIPRSIVADVVWDLKLDTAFKLTRALSFWQDHEVRSELIKALIKIDAWYPGVSFEIMNSLSDTRWSYLLDENNPEMIETMGAFFESAFSPKNRLKFFAASLPFYWIIPREFRPSKQKKQLASRLGIMSFDRQSEIRQIAYESLKKLPVSPRELYPLQSDYAHWFKRNKELLKAGTNTNYRGWAKQPRLRFIPYPFDSRFELDMFLALNEKGYVVLPQFLAPFEGSQNFRADFLIVDAKDPNKHLVVECDGPHHNDPHRQELDTQRQKEWEDQGFKFWRVASLPDPDQPQKSYFYEPSREGGAPSGRLPAWPDREIHKDSLDRLFKLLEMNGIRPARNPSATNPAQNL